MAPFFLSSKADEYVVYSPHQQQMQYLVEFTLAVDSEEEREGEEREEEGKEGEEGGRGEVAVGSEGEDEKEETATGGEGEGCEEGLRIWGVRIHSISPFTLHSGTSGIAPVQSGK